jgi:Cu+-exporting ATPase
MDTLLALGTSAAYGYSVLAMISSAAAPPPPGEPVSIPLFFETAVFLIFFVFLGRLLEGRARGRTSAAIGTLMSLQPASAVVVGGRGGEEEEEVAVELVEVGDVLRVQAGARVPTDGLLVRETGEGGVDVDESMITGEAAAVHREVGESVIGGSVVVQGQAYVRATRVGGDTALAQIASLVATAQSSKAPIQAVADRIAGDFVPTVVAIAAIDFIAWFSLTTSGIVPASWLPPNESPFLFSLLFAISVLVIACPCALGLATPTAIMVATGVGAEHGLLLKGGAALEGARSVRAVAFDKTGTLTLGKPAVSSLVVAPRSASTKEPQVIVGKELADFRQTSGRLRRSLRLLAAAEATSAHPLATAVVSFVATVTGSPSSSLPVTSTSTLPGRGIIATVDGHVVAVGSRALMDEQGISVAPALTLAAEKGEAAGASSVYAAVDGRLAVVVGLTDEVRREAGAVVRALERRGVAAFLVTGDNERTAAAVGASVDIDPSRVLANVLPQNKAAVVRELQAGEVGVMMVGDGVNDAPALAAADVGVAVGAGTDVAIESASVVLMRPSLEGVVHVLDLAKATHRRILLNFAFAFAFNVACIPLAAGVFYPAIRPTRLPPVVAGAAMAASSIFVVLSSLALRRWKPKNIL